MGHAALAGLEIPRGHDQEAEAHWARAAATIEIIGAKLVTPQLRRSFLTAAPVQAIYRALGRTAPVP